MNDELADQCYHLSNDLLGMWSRLEKHECHHRRAFGELLYRCSHALTIMCLFSGSKSNIEQLRAAIMQCVTPADILKCDIQDLTWILDGRKQEEENKK